MIAQEQRDYVQAEAWYRKSLAIREKQGNEHGAAITYAQLGLMAAAQRDFGQAGQQLLQALRLFASNNDPAHVRQAAQAYWSTYQRAPAQQRAALRSMWDKAKIDFIAAPPWDKADAPPEGESDD